jgi:DNA primase
MRYYTDMDAKDLIKQKLNIVDVVGEYVVLKQAGTNHKGLCPFHNEKSPSFMVSEDKQIFHCFGCHEGGDSIAFIQKIEGMDFVEALKHLADRAGVTLDLKSQKNVGQANKSIEVLRVAENFYHQVLMTTDVAQEAREYLKKRGLTDMSIDVWKIGFAPHSWDTTLKALYSKKFSDQEILAAGLAIRNEKGKIYDRFRGRITFPIKNTSGKTVGFTCRILPSLDDGKTGKYINTPQTDVYNKSEIVFGLDKAKKAIRDLGYAVVVEGNMDVILSYQAGVENVVASSGTALTQQQVQQLKRLTDTLYLNFDRDEAGKQAALRGIDVALAEGMNIKVILLPEEVKDAADLVCISPEKWKLAVGRAVPMMEYYLDVLVKEFDVATGVGKKKASDAFRNMLNKFTDDVEKMHWISKASQRLDVDEDALRVGVTTTRTKRKYQQSVDTPSIHKTKAERLFELVYSLAFENAESFAYVAQKLTPESVILPEHKELVKLLILYYNQMESYVYEDFLVTLPEELLTLHNKLVLIASLEVEALTTQERFEELKKALGELYKETLKTKLHTLQHQLRLAEQRNDPQEIEKIMHHIAHVQHDLNTF